MSHSMAYIIVSQVFTYQYGAHPGKFFSMGLANSVLVLAEKKILTFLLVAGIVLVLNLR